MLANMNKLLGCHNPFNYNIIVNGNMSCKATVIGNNNMIANPAVMPQMRIGHN